MPSFVLSLAGVAVTGMMLLRTPGTESLPAQDFSPGWCRWRNWAFPKDISQRSRSKCCCLVTKSCLTLLWPHGLEPTRVLYPWDFPGENAGADCHFLLRIHGPVLIHQHRSSSWSHFDLEALMLFPVGSEYPISLGWICYRCQPTVLLKVLQNLFIHFPERKNNLQSALNYHYFFGNFLKSSKENISIPSTTTLPIQTELEKKGCFFC